MALSACVAYLIGCTSDQIDDAVSSSMTCPITEITPEHIDTGNIAVLSTQNVIEIHSDSGKFKYKLSSMLYFGVNGDVKKNILPSIAANNISFKANGSSIGYAPINEMAGSKLSSCPKWYYPGFVYYFGNFNDLRLVVNAEKNGKVFKIWQMNSLVDTSKFPVMHDTVISDSVIKLEISNRNPSMKQRIRFDYSTGLFSPPDSVVETGNSSVLINLNRVPFSNFQKVIDCGYEHYGMNVVVSLPIGNCDETNQICATSYQYIQSVSPHVDSTICKYRIDH